MTKKHDIIKITGSMEHESQNAYLFWDGSFEFERFGLTLTQTKKPKKVWLPKSQCEWDPTTSTMQMPEWLAVEKELI